ncbi:MAG: VIT1/CCC1 transporter family protein [Sphingomonas sp.]
MAKNEEKHLISRVGWLRAAVLGANDGIVSTASLIIGVAAAHQPQSAILVTGVAGLVAGAMSMAAGEYVSVSSQRDTEEAERAKEAQELKNAPQAELQELTRIYVERGLDTALAEQVARQLTERNALEAHMRDELGLTSELEARPVQAAIASAASFTAGAAFPLLLVLLLPLAWVAPGVGTGSLAYLAVLGVVGALAGGAPVLWPTVRVTFWGGIAMAVTAGVGLAVGHVG